MRLVAAAIAATAMMPLPSHAAVVLYSFTGTGAGTDWTAQRTGFQNPQTVASGNVTIDTSNATQTDGGWIYNQTFTVSPDANPITYSVYGSAIGDRLYLSLLEDGLHTPGLFENQFTLTADFAPGYLGGVFPTTIDFSKLISGSYSAGFETHVGHGDYTTSIGQLDSLTAQVTDGLAPRGTAYVHWTGVAAVPEPTTWATMLVGMFAVAMLLRQRRPKPQSIPAIA